MKRSLPDRALDASPGVVDSDSAGSCALRAPRAPRLTREKGCRTPESARRAPRPREAHLASRSSGGAGRAAEAGQNLGYTLAKLGYICDEEITNFLSQQYRVPTINLDEYEIDAEILKLVSKEQCEKHRVMPGVAHGQLAHRRDGRSDEPHAIDDLKFLTGYNIEPVIASETAILAAIEQVLQRRPLVRRGHGRFRRDGRSSSPATTRTSNLLELEKASEDAPVVRLVNMILLNAIKKGASDIHIEPYEKKLRVRYRVDGVLHRGDDAAAQAEERDREPHQDHEPRSTSPSAACRRTGASS